MSTYKQLLIVTIIAIIINILNMPATFPMQQNAAPQKEDKNQSQIQKTADEALKHLAARADYVRETSNSAVFRANEAMGLAYSSNETSIKAFQSAKKALDIARQALDFANKASTEIEKSHAVTSNLKDEYHQLSAALAKEVEKAKEKIIGATKIRGKHDLENKIKMTQAKINEKQQQGIYQQAEKIRAQASIDTEKEKWKNIRKIIGDSKPIIKIALVIILTTLCIYIIKYGIPALIDYLSLPRVISETSRKGWFDRGKTQQNIDIDDLIFSPYLEKQLSDILLRIQSAKKYNEALPNILFHGTPGTGKTAFAKALAYASKLDYALTSGSEFVKITNLKTANDELRKLLNWAKKGSKGLIVFFDEADSLFPSRNLSTTTKTMQDFINTFLSLISDQSQKNLMFIFATNHPFKLDNSIINRIGISVEFTLPTAPEREKILFKYLIKFAQENTEALVDLNTEIIQFLSKYADSLENFSPRAIKFVAEEMIINARRQKPKQLTNAIAQDVVDKTKHNMQQTILWEKEYNKFAESLTIAQKQR